jgi:hypothetical protein
MFLPKLLFLSLIFFISFPYTHCEDEETEEDSGDICDCGNTDINKTCCFIEKDENSIKCEAFDKYILFSKEFIYDETNINITCNKKYQKKTCGTNNPKKLFQCREHSSNSYTCCMIDIDGNTNCILADDKIEANYTFEDNVDIKEQNVKLYCKENYIKVFGIKIRKINYYFFIVFLFMMLF